MTTMEINSPMFRTSLGILSIALIMLCASLPASKTQAQSLSGKKRIAHEAIWLMRRVGPPVPSPDGKSVVFLVTEPAYDEKEQVSDLWIVPADGSAKARRLTFSKGAESGAAWSPDGRRLAFSAKREGDEVTQIYVIDVDGGGEAVRLTTLSTGARMPQWSPDGRSILFTSPVYPGAASEDENRKIAEQRKARKYRARVYDGFPIRHWDKWLDDVQTHLFVQSVEPGSVAKDLLAGTRLAAEPGFGGRGTLTGDEIDAVWAPDGRSIVFSATRDRNKAAYAFTSTHLYQVPAEGGEPRAITSGTGDHVKPAFRPDGGALFCLYTEQTGKVYSLDRVAQGHVKVLGR